MLVSIQHIQEYWLDYVFGLIILGLSFVCRSLYKKLKTIKKENEGIKHGVKALLHNEIMKMGKDLIAQGYCSPEDYQEMEYLFEPYHDDLDGNGSAERMMNQVRALPPAPIDKDDRFNTRSDD